MEYLETAYIADENAKYYNHFGKQLGNFFRIYGSRFHKLTIHLYRCHSFLKASKKKTPAWSLFRPARLWGPGHSAPPPPALHQGAPGGRGEEGCTLRPRSYPTRLRKPGSPRRGHALRSPRRQRQGGGGWSRAGRRPRSPCPSSPLTWSFIGRSRKRDVMK